MGVTGAASDKVWVTVVEGKEVEAGGGGGGAGGSVSVVFFISASSAN